MSEARINIYREAIVETIKTSMPALKSCKIQFGRFDLDALERELIKAPAVRVAVLSAGLNHGADGAPKGQVKCAAFIITSDKNRDKSAWAIAEGIATLLNPKQFFNIFNMGAPKNINIVPVVSSNIKNKGVAIIAVEWSQSLNGFGDGIFDKEGHLIEELYVNDEVIGLENV